MVYTAPRPRSHSPQILHLLGLAVLAGILLFIGLGDLGLTDRDEGSNAEAAREMLESGDWISPTLNGEPRYAKPAFVYWIIAGTYSILGVNEFSARLPSAIFGLTLILVHYLFLTRLLGASIAFIGALMLLLNLEVIASSRMVLTDPELVLFTTLSAYGFWLGFHGTGRQRYWMWGFYLGMALATLTKGPIGILIPLFGVMPYLTITRQWKQFWQTGFPLLGTVVCLLIASPWYIAMFTIHGVDYLTAAQANTTGRFANPMEGHGGTIFFFIPVLLVSFFPWSGFLPLALSQALKPWKALRAGEQHLTNEQRLTFFAALWAIGIFLFFSLSATRLPHYILPLFPAASILTAVFWSRMLAHISPAPSATALQEEELPVASFNTEASNISHPLPSGKSPSGLKGSLIILVITGYLLALLFASIPAIYEHFQETIAVEFPTATKINPGLIALFLGGVFFVGTTIIRHLASVEKRRPMVVGIAGGMITLVMLTIIIVALPPFHKHFIAPPQKLATIAGLNLGTEGHLVQFGRKRPSLIFYAKHPIVQISPGEDEKFQALRKIPGKTMIILQSHLRARLPSPESEFSVLLTHQGFSLLSSEDMMPSNRPQNSH